MPFEASELLRVAHDLAKVDVKHVAAVPQHDVVVVAVADAQDEGGHAPASTGVDEVHHGLQTEALILQLWRRSERSGRGENLVVVLLSFVPHVEPLLQRVFSEAPSQTPLLLDLPQRHCFWNHLHQT